MKTALELLGKVRDAQFISAEGHNITLPPSVFEDWLNLVAERAREEERDRCIQWAGALRMGDIDDVRSVIAGIQSGDSFDTGDAGEEETQ